MRPWHSTARHTQMMHTQVDEFPRSANKEVGVRDVDVDVHCALCSVHYALCTMHYACMCMCIHVSIQSDVSATQHTDGLQHQNSRASALTILHLSTT